MAVSFALGACQGPGTGLQLYSGDLLFSGYEVDESASGLSQAIDAVTQTPQATSYTHMGLVAISEGQVWVYHADPKKGVCKELLDSFLFTRPLTDVYRLKAEYRHAIAPALEMAESLLGLPYDRTYILNDSSQYCSGMIYQVFRAHQIFSLAPMNFKDPASGEILPAWQKHYQALGLEVPQGLPGCNPNGMAAEQSLEYIGPIRPS